MEIIYYGLIYILHEEDKTAEITGEGISYDDYGDLEGTVYISESVNYNNRKFIITRIKANSFKDTFHRSIQILSDYKLHTIEKNAFYSTFINQITIPMSVTKLEKGWCKNATNLNEVRISSENKYFKNLEGNEKLIVGKSDINSSEYDILVFACRDFKDVIIPPNITQIASYAFSETQIDSIFIPKNVKQISEGCFYHCYSLDFIEFALDSELEVIEKDAFYYIPIERISIPVKVKKLEDGWCKMVSDLIEVTINPDNLYFKNYEENEKLIVGKSDLNSNEYDVLVFACRYIEDATIPPNIKIIASYAFSQTQIESIFIPLHVKKICKGAFFDCKNLRNVAISKTSELQFIGKNAFYSAYVESLMIPSTFSEFEKGWNNYFSVRQMIINPDNLYFKNCEENRNLIIRKSDANNNDYDILVFASRNIKCISIPRYIKQIGSFSLSYSSFRKILIPSQVTHICEHAFDNCTHLRHVEFTKDSKLEIIEQYSFYNSGIENISIPFYVKKIGKSAFNGCEKLKKVEIQQNSKLQIIEENAFEESSITCIYIPSHVVSIGIEAFSSCHKLQIVEFGEKSKMSSM